MACMCSILVQFGYFETDLLVQLPRQKIDGRMDHRVELLRQTQQHHPIITQPHTNICKTSTINREYYVTVGSGCFYFNRDVMAWRLVHTCSMLLVNVANTLSPDKPLWWTKAFTAKKQSAQRNWRSQHLVFTRSQKKTYLASEVHRQLYCQASHWTAPFLPYYTSWLEWTRSVHRKKSTGSFLENPNVLKCR